MRKRNVSFESLIHGDLCVPFAFRSYTCKVVWLHGGIQCVKSDEPMYDTPNWHYTDSFRFRMDPVPGTGKHNSKFSFRIREFRIFQEVKMSYACSRRFIRGKRLPTSLPDPWDDKPIVIQRSWKTHGKRHKQWMKN